MIDNSPKNNPNHFIVDIDEAKDIYIRAVDPTVINIEEAFRFSLENNLYMADAHLVMNGYDIKHFTHDQRKAQLNFSPKMKYYNFLIAPFARSLPQDQKWQIEKWNELVRRFPDLTFGVLGNTKHDDPNAIQGDNVTPLFDNSLIDVAGYMKASKYGLLSVVTGLSHMAYHLSVPNYLLFNQDFAWGRNPDATVLHKKVDEITVDEFVNLIKSKTGLK